MKLLRVLNGEAVWPPPVWLMRQAGRYLPEYRALRAEAGDFLSLCMNPPLAAEITLQPIKRFGFDAAILFSDILILPMALGQALRFAEGEGPVLPPLQDLSGLDLARAPGAYAPVIETVRLVKAALGTETGFIGFAGGPMTVACYMLDGKGGGEFPRSRTLAYTQPEFVAELLDILVDATIVYLSAQIEAGVDCVMLFESWAGIFPPEHFLTLVIEPAQKIVSALKAKHQGVKVIGFPRLSGLMLGRYARETGVDAVGLDTVVDPQAAIAACPAGTVFQGNFDPLLLKTGGPAMIAGAKRLLHAFEGQNYIFNLGHGITPDVPVEHVEQLLAVIRAA